VTSLFRTKQNQIKCLENVGSEVVASPEHLEALCHQNSILNIKV